MIIFSTKKPSEEGFGIIGKNMTSKKYQDLEKSADQTTYNQSSNFSIRDLYLLILYTN
jgi:hypothetical protein